MPRPFATARAPRQGFPVVAVAGGIAAAVALVVAARVLRSSGAEAASPPPPVGPPVAAEVAAAPAPAPSPAAPQFPATALVEPAPAETGTIDVLLPTGAVTALRLTSGGGALVVEPSLAPKSRIERIFTLGNPDRLVVDVAGLKPASRAVRGAGGTAKAVRVGKRPNGTRLVVDLAYKPSRVAREGGRIEVWAQ